MTGTRAWRPLVPGPRAVTLMLTTRCNLSCAYCPQRRGPPREMSEATLEAAVRLVAASGHPRPKLVLFGGEPLLAKGLVRRALAVLAGNARKGLAPDVRLVTNGLLLDEETLDLLEEHGVAVELSCDGLPEAQERRGPGTAPLLADLLHRLASRRPEFLASRLVVRATLDSGNVALFSSSFASLAAAGVREFLPALVNTPDPGWNDAAAARLDKELGLVVLASLRLAASGGGLPFVPFRPEAARRPALTTPACSLGAPDVLFVDVDGAVSPCGAFADSVHPVLPPLAEEIREPLRGVRVGEPRLAERLARRWQATAVLPALRPTPVRRSPRGACASCAALADCSVCPASIALAPEQDAGLVPASQCDLSRLMAKHRRAFLVRLASWEAALQRSGRRSSAPATSAATPARIDGA